MKSRFLIAALVALFAAAAHAQPVPAVDTAAPISIQRGESLEITLTGASLAKVFSVAVPDDAGLTATLAKPEKPADAEAKLTLAASPDAAPGVREIRLVTPTGVSNPVPVWVEQYPLVHDKAPNTDPAKPQPISLPAIITGKMDAPGDADCYRFTALRGQRLVFNLIAARARSSMDGNLVISDAATGREMAANNDTFGADPFLAFDVPADGQYVLEVRDVQYRGSTGPEFGYRIEAGAIPFVQALTPAGSRRGGMVDVKATGYNLGADDTIRLDLRYVSPGRIPLRIKTGAGGFSNEVPFDVTELPPATEAEPNDELKSATNVKVPTDVSGVIARPNDLDFFRFTLHKPTRIVAEAVANRIGSPLDPLLTLHDSLGNSIRISDDDAAGVDARLGYDLTPGEYFLSLRDLSYAGGPAYAYRITLRSTLAPADAPAQDFSLKFQPDTPRLRRGGYAKLWCDVSRQNFPADVTLTVEGLPPGVTVASPAVFPAVTSGVLMLAASADAPLGSYPISIKATAPLNGQLATRVGQPESMGRVVQQAYLTVLDAAPLSVQPLATLPPAQLQQLTADIPALASKVLASSPEFDARQAAWEKKVAAGATWVVLKPASLGSNAKASLAEQPDGSILVAGREAGKDTYTIEAHTNLKGIAAVRLECLPHPSLGGNGPGRAPNGNFVLTRLALTIAPKSNPVQKTPVEFAKAQATFSQADYDVARAIDDNATTGWAISPEMGKPQTAMFTTKAPVGDGADSVLTFTLDQNYGVKHVLGHFRISVSTDPAAADVAPVPEAILAIAKTPTEQRSPEQRSQIAAHYRSIDPAVAADRAKLDLLRATVAPLAEIARLDAAVKQQSPQVDAEQAQWEQSVLAGAGWTPLDPTELRSAAGASLAKEPDGSVFAFGALPPTDTYTIVAPTPLKGVTGLRIEAIPDPRLPAGGSGRANSGNFVLSHLKVAAAPAPNPAAAQPSTQPVTPQPVEIAGAVASFAQENFPVAGTLDAKPETGWAVAPLHALPAAAEFYFKAPVGSDGGSIFTITLDQAASAIPHHLLGRFRISVTTAPTADGSAGLPATIMAILKTPAAQRTPEQKAEVAGYHRRISKLLQPVRQRLAEHRAAAPAFPAVAQRSRPGMLPVALTRGPNFPTGDVTVTLEGFSAGRDANGPIPIARSLKLTPLTIPADQMVGVLNFTPEANAEQGTRHVVLRAEAKVGNDTIVQYSPAFPLTVK